MVRKCRDLSPTALFLYKRASEYRKKFSLQKKKALNIKKRFKEATAMASKKSFTKLSMQLSDTSRNFFESQLRCVSKKPRAWRFTTNDKITALALYKQTGSGYKFLQQLFSLPSRVTIMKLINNIYILNLV